MLFGKKDYYSGSLKLLAEKGYCAEYIAALREELASAAGNTAKADGRCRLANALLFSGELKAAAEAFAETDIKSVPKESRQAYAANYIMCLFFLDKLKDADRIYEEYNRYALDEANALLKRTVGIHEFISKRYDSAVTVFIKLLSEANDDRGTIMADICTVRAMLKLDMTKEAESIADGFARYDGKGELTDLCRKLRKKIFDAASPQKKVSMVKQRNKIKKKH